MAPTLTPRKRELRPGTAAYPLFVTSDKITPELIDKFLETEFELTRVDKSTDSGVLPCFYLVTEESLPDPSTTHKNDLGENCIVAPIKELSVAPTPQFTSPFIGKSVDELHEVCKNHFFRNPFAAHLFAVLDDRAARDQKSVLLVEDVHPFKSVVKRELMRARAEFGYAGYILAAPSQDISLLTEGAHHPKYADPEDGDDKEEVYFCGKNTELLSV